MIKKIGLTGGIGSGKSTVARIFETYGYLVYYADDRARFLSDNDPIVKEGIVELFGENIFKSDGKLDRKSLGGIVFNDKSLLEKLNAIVHPATFRDFNDWYKSIDSGYKKKFVLEEAAILFETGSWKNLDGIINVHANEALRIDRVIKRDGTTAEAVKARIDKQVSDEYRIENSDFTIRNEGEVALIPQVQAAIKFFEDKWAN